MVIVALITLPDALALPRTAGHGLGRRVLRDAVRPPAYPGIPMDQDADAPHGDAQDDEQMNVSMNAGGRNPESQAIYDTRRIHTRHELAATWGSTKRWTRRSSVPG